MADEEKSGQPTVGLLILLIIIALVILYWLTMQDGSSIINQLIDSSKQLPAV